MLTSVALTGWLRLTQYQQAWADGRLLPLGGDSAYHLRRMLLFAAGGDTAAADPHMGFPPGAVAIWPPGFDVIGAAFVALLGSGEASSDALVAGTFPVVLAVVTAVLVVEIIRALGQPPWVAMLAGVVYALIPQSIAIGRFARIDHHIAEAMFTAGLLLWTLKGLGIQKSTPAHRSTFEALGAALVALAIWSAMVNLIIVGIATIALIATALFASTEAASSSAPEPASARSARFATLDIVGTGAPAMLVGGVWLGVLFAPQVVVHGETFSHARPSFLQPLLLGLAAVVIGATHICLRWLPSRLSTSKKLLLRLGVSAVSGALTVAVAILILPEVGQALWAGSLDYMGSGDAWLAGIGEIQPLFLDSPLTWSGWQQPYKFYGPVLPALPVTAFFAWRRLGTRGRAQAVVVLGWTAILLTLTLMQSRWGRPMTALVAIVTALGISGVITAAFARIEASLARFAIPIAVAVLLAFAQGTKVTPTDSGAPSPLQEAAISLSSDEAGAPAGGQGVLSTWDHGNQILALSGRPVMVGGFGPYITPDLFLEAEHIWLATPDELDDFMRAKDLGYIVAGAGTFYPQRVTQSGALPLVRDPDGRGRLSGSYFSEVPCGVLLVGGSGAPKRGIHHLPHLRPRFASTEAVTGLSEPLPVLWAFERVEGALLSGRATPGTRVVAGLDLRFASGKFHYRAWTDTDAVGRFQLRMPVATDALDAGLSTSSAVLLERWGRAPVEIAVPIEAVYAGAAIPIPE